MLSIEKFENEEIKPVTIEDIRSCPGLEDISDEVGQQILNFFDGLAEIAFDFVIEQEALNRKRKNEKLEDT